MLVLSHSAVQTDCIWLSSDSGPQSEGGQQTLPASLQHVPVVQLSAYGFVVPELPVLIGLAENGLPGVLAATRHVCMRGSQL